jgi:cytochrome c-type biogenesis protein CcsB
MRKWIHTLASLKFTVALLVVILMALAAGTIIESTQSAEAARAVYYAPWFHFLLAVFSLNLLCGLVDKWPWSRARIGFALTHSSMLVILGGALLSHAGGTSGRIALWEGEESSTFVQTTKSGAEVSKELPFVVHLDAFEIDVYPGTMRPAMFRSRVTVKEKGATSGFAAAIQMNHELTYRGYKLFQSSYQVQNGRKMTVLSVSRDPGMLVVFIGYGILVAGMITVLSTRISQRRALSAQLRAHAASLAAAALPAALALAGTGLALLALLAAPAAHAGSLPDAATVETLRTLPIQHDGRVMPLDTKARAAVREVVGRGGWNGIDPVALVLGWTFSPEEWAAVPMVRLGRRELGRQVGFPAGAKRLSYQELVGNSKFLDLVDLAHQKSEADQHLTKAEKAAMALEDRLLILRAFLTGQTWNVIPTPDPTPAWGVPDSLKSPADLIAAGGRALQQAPAYYPTAGAIAREITYNRVNPSRLAWWILLPATLLSVLAWQKPRRPLVLLSAAGLLGGFAVMTWGILTRWQIAGHIPASNMYEAMLFLAWGVGLFALIASAILKNRLVIMNAAAMSTLAMMLANLLPIDPYIHPIPTVLSGTPWLAIHVPIIMVSYSVLTLGVLVAHMQVGLAITGKGRSPQGMQMNDLLYWYMHIGSILLIIGILTGSIWAASSWGRYWGWDPKEVWSLVAFLAYMAILHGRFDRFIGPFGVAVASIAAFWMILMTYIGVNFVLASGLHSYGFGSSSVVQVMGIVLVAEILFLLAGWRGMRKSKPPAALRVARF